MSKRILIVDDEENIREMVRLALEAAGYEVGEASSGLETFAILGSDAEWDVVLLDQKMPGMEGLDVMKRVRILAPKTRVIMVTAFSTVELAVAAMKLGAVDFVRKPMTPEILRNAVSAALEKREIAEAAPSSSLGRPTIGNITLNGFTILRPSDIGRALPQGPAERRFIVRSPGGREEEVTVEISEQAIKSAEKIAGPRLPIEKAFWTEQAERFLSDFLWNDGQVPSGRLTLKGVDRNAHNSLMVDED